MRTLPLNALDWQVRALLDGRKTQDRQLVKPRIKAPTLEGDALDQLLNGVSVTLAQFTKVCPCGEVGDQLWVCEAWAAWSSHSDDEADELTCSVADMVEMGIGRAHLSYRSDPGFHADRWRPSTQMPRWASRITMEITAVGLQRIQAITEEEARTEGVQPIDFEGYEHPDNRTLSAAAFRGSFHDYWRSRYPHSWERNDWVYVRTLRRIQP